MASIRARKDNDMLFFDFHYLGRRYREQTTLKDTPANRRSMMAIMKKIDAEIMLGSFDYAAYFPSSPNVKRCAVKQAETVIEVSPVFASPKLSEFAWEWFHENTVRWKHSYREHIEGIINQYLVPVFGDKEVGSISKGDILKFRSSLAKVQNGKREGLSPDRINHIMTPLRMMLTDAADRYDFSTPFTGIKPLAVPRTEVDPFSLEEVELILAAVRPDFKRYYTVRFYTGLRTAEVDGLKWRYVDFARSEILIRETLVKGITETTKTAESARAIAMSSRVRQSLVEQHALNGGKSEYVFSDRTGGALNYTNVSKRVWYPLLEHLGLKKRRPYQTRHTTATLWLASGENPEWIARQMGHTTTKMLFTIYSRFVPNLTRKDGSAFERLLLNQQSQEVNNDNR
jgi:integrase